MRASGPRMAGGQWDCGQWECQESGRQTDRDCENMKVVLYMLVAYSDAFQHRV